ncbi:MAG TPA: MotA/TolQ/ExbB proton channel family protein [Kiloniellaceae bacterium]|nr:MotA/TolQ/ExbB proton channel family protein [Kiloniellaceae bacterium]
MTTADRPQRQPGRGTAAPPIRRIFSHPVILALALGGALLAIFLMDRLLPASLAVVLLDKDGSSYPFTVQTVMWLVFAVGCGELVVRLRDAVLESRELRHGYLPEDATTILQAPELRRIFAATKETESLDPTRQRRFLPRLILRVVTQFQTNESVEQATSILNSSLELFLHEVDLRYSMVRYVVWAIPTLGFIGTVVGISLALAFAGEADLQDPSLLAELTKRLAVAFNTTLLALVMSSVLVLIQHVVQAFEERALNDAGQYCLDNLINRLYVA